ncbi:MAG: aminotransferase class I/II-fold pyridoxal phosphate-dependent enzyme [Chloroflexi bacterium]|nr:aminotransferase class I/II-fold pyridoxal phosphate-dependent enzyme [Chloroflexota bacterium]
MREAMARAEVGDDVLRDDPTVQRLEEASAERVGKEAALYVPSGTMANLLALLVTCGRGDEAVVGSESHILHHEAVGASALGGISLRSVANDDRGRIDPAEVASVVRAPGAAPRTVLVCLENTQNRCGGAAIPLDSMRGASEVAHGAGAAVHLDGARIFNAALALETDAATIAGLADTASFCFSKGLGAPVGSVLTGPSEVIDRARVLRRQLGGGMRQAGVIAAAALHALEHHVERLAEDHERAARLADGLASLPGGAIEIDTPDTNIVFFELDGSVDGVEFRERLAAEGVLCSGTGPQRVRMVTHLDIDDAAIDGAVAAAGRVIESMRAA